MNPPFWFPFGSMGLLYLDMLAPHAPELEQEMSTDTRLGAPSTVWLGEVPAMYDPGPAGVGDPTTWVTPGPGPIINGDGCRREGGKCSCSSLGPCEATIPKSWWDGREIPDGHIAVVRRPLTWSDHPAGSRGDWMQTASGRAFYPMNPRPEEIHIEDIAAALSKMCRYGGHTTRFYSVAEHCVLMSRVASPSVAFEALMHDASEAYLSDVIRPIKPFLSNYREIEERLERAIARRFDLQWPMPAEVKRLDNAILADERDQAMAVPPQDWRLPEPPLGVTLQFWSPEKAEYEFLASFARLRG